MRGQTAKAISVQLRYGEDRVFVRHTSCRSKGSSSPWPYRFTFQKDRRACMIAAACGKDSLWQRGDHGQSADHVLSTSNTVAESLPMAPDRPDLNVGPCGHIVRKVYAISIHVLLRMTRGLDQVSYWHDGARLGSCPADYLNLPSMCHLVDPVEPVNGVTKSNKKHEICGEILDPF